jgi:antitoxin ParD1/3/4
MCDYLILLMTLRVCQMAIIRKTIALTEQQGNWIKAKIKSGYYTNDSEYIRDLIRREQERSAEIEAVRGALIEGEESGEPKRFDAAIFKERITTSDG